MRTIVLTLTAVLLMFCMGTIAQSPTEPEPSEVDLRRQMAELKAELATTRAETKSLVTDKLKVRNAQLASAKEKAEAQQRRQARLALLIFERGEVQNKIKEMQTRTDADKLSLEALLNRNKELENQIRKANRTFACRFLHLGCVRFK